MYKYNNKFHALHVDDSTIQSSGAELCRDHCISIPASVHRRPELSASITAIQGRPRLSTAVSFCPQPSLPSTAVNSYSFPSTTATVVRGRPQPSRPSTAGHGCPRVATAVHGRPSAAGRPATAARGRREGAQNEHSVSTVLIGF